MIAATNQQHAMKRVLPFIDLEIISNTLRSDARAMALVAEIERELQKLFDAKIDEAAVEVIARRIADPLDALMQAYVATLSDDEEELRAIAMHHLRMQQEQLAARITDDGRSDTIKWVFGWLRTITKLVVEPHDRETELIPYVSGIAAVMAASRAVKDERFDEADALIDVAFFALLSFEKRMSKHDIKVEPFPDETKEERRARIRRTHELVSSAFSDEDWVVMDAAMSRRR